ncbi:MAG: hypothetical protein ACREPM_09485, partial [Gemmatimonadaceae bacterium]
LVGSVTRSNGATMHYDAHLKPHAAVDRLTLNVHGGRGNVTEIKMWEKGDSTFLQDGPDTVSVAGTNVIPNLNFSYAMFEQALRHSATLGGKTTTVHWIRVLQNATITDAVVTRPAPDSAIMTSDKTEFRFEIDKDGRLIHGVSPANDLHVYRVKP